MFDEVLLLVQLETCCRFRGCRWRCLCAFSRVFAGLFWKVLVVVTVVRLYMWSQGAPVLSLGTWVTHVGTMARAGELLNGCVRGVSTMRQLQNRDAPTSFWRRYRMRVRFFVVPWVRKQNSGFVRISIRTRELRQYGRYYRRLLSIYAAEVLFWDICGRVAIGGDCG